MADDSAPEHEAKRMKLDHEQQIPQPQQHVAVPNMTNVNVFDSNIDEHGTTMTAANPIAEEVSEEHIHHVNQDAVQMAVAEATAARMNEFVEDPTAPSTEYQHMDQTQTVQVMHHDPNAMAAQMQEHYQQHDPNQMVQMDEQQMAHQHQYEQITQYEHEQHQHHMMHHQEQDPNQQYQGHHLVTEGGAEMSMEAMAANAAAAAGVADVSSVPINVPVSVEHHHAHVGMDETGQLQQQAIESHQMINGVPVTVHQQHQHNADGTITITETVQAHHPSMPPLVQPQQYVTHEEHAQQHEMLQVHPSAMPKKSRPSHTLPTTDPAYRRKDKSLGVLCSNFMRRYTQMFSSKVPVGTTAEVTIDEASQSLMVERRRIYDIINILEAIEVVTRKGKNTYHWHGMGNITDTLRKMQTEAFEIFPNDVELNNLNGNDGDNKDNEQLPTGFAMLLASAEQVDQPMKKGKEKSLGRLSQKFVMLFLVGHETISLEDASDKILGKTNLPLPPPNATAEEMLKIRNSNNKMIKTKIRRLYDIANIMASVGLIQKLQSDNHTSSGNPRARPMFKWIYPLTAREILNYSDRRVQQTVDGQKIIVPIPEKEVKINEDGIIEHGFVPSQQHEEGNVMQTYAQPNNMQNQVIAQGNEDSLTDTANAVVNAIELGNDNDDVVKAAEDAAMIAHQVVNGTEGTVTENTMVQEEALQAAVAVAGGHLAVEQQQYSDEPNPVHNPNEDGTQDNVHVSVDESGIPIQEQQHLHEPNPIMMQESEQVLEEGDGTTVPI